MSRAGEPTDDRPGRLLELAVRDLALIERLRLELEPGLNVLTGETGAGKSLLIDALGLGDCPGLTDAALGDLAGPGRLKVLVLSMTPRVTDAGLLVGLAQHDAYHTGQLALVRRLVEAADTTR